MKKIVIAGGRGFLGRCLIRHYSKRVNEIVILTRNPKPSQLGERQVFWDGKNPGKWVEELKGADLLINLAGKSVDCRYTERNKKAIFDSRTDSTAALENAISSLKNPPKLWLNSSSATYYRHSLDQPMDEKTGEAGTGFSVEVCKKWEATFNRFNLPKTRKVIMRTAMVLGNDGGAFPMFSRLTRLGLGGRMGGGLSLIHI